MKYLISSLKSCITLLIVFASLNTYGFDQISNQLKAAEMIKDPFVNTAEIQPRILAVGQALRRNHDSKGLFAEVYAVTMNGIIHFIKEKKFKNSLWAEKLLVNFANIYRDILYNELVGNTHLVPESWASVFELSKDREVQLSSEMMASMRAHISRDLVYALLATQTDFKSASIYADYILIAQALKGQTKDIWVVMKNYGPHHNILPTALEEKILVSWAIQWRIKTWSRASKISQSKTFYEEEIALFNLEKIVSQRIQEIKMVRAVIR